MADRPQLSKNLDPNTFRNFYYLKEELVAFCKKQGLPAGGGKLELTERIACYLSTGEAPPAPAPAPARAKAPAGPITPETPIEPGFVCSERHRAFFRGQLGPGFSFNVPFQKWLKANAGKTYRQAAEAYRLLLEEKKAGKPPHRQTVRIQHLYPGLFCRKPRQNPAAGHPVLETQKGACRPQPLRSRRPGGPERIRAKAAPPGGLCSYSYHRRTQLSAPRTPGSAAAPGWPRPTCGTRCSHAFSPCSR